MVSQALTSTIPSRAEMLQLHHQPGVADGKSASCILAALKTAYRSKRCTRPAVAPSTDAIAGGSAGARVGIVS